jgi:hypothetical protein
MRKLKVILLWNVNDEETINVFNMKPVAVSLWLTYYCEWREYNTIYTVTEDNILLQLEWFRHFVPEFKK